MAVLERTSFSRDAFYLTAPKLCVLDSGDIVSTYILTDARNTHWFWAVTHISYSMPHDENKEYKAYSRWIFLNLRPNGIARIIEHLQKAMFVPTRRTNVYNQRNLSNFLQKEVPMGSETCPKNSGEWCSLTFRPKKSCLRPNLRVLRASWCKRVVFSGFEYLPRAFWVLVGPKRTPNDKVMTVLVNTGPFYGSPWKNFIFPWSFLPHRLEIFHSTGSFLLGWQTFTRKDFTRMAIFH